MAIALSVFGFLIAALSFIFLMGSMSPIETLRALSGMLIAAVLLSASAVVVKLEAIRREVAKTTAK